MLNRFARLPMSTSILKLAIKRHSPSIKRHSPSNLYISASLAMSTTILKALPDKLDIKRHSPIILYVILFRPIVRKFNSIICRFFAPHSQDNTFSLLHLWGAKKRQMMLLNFLSFFIIWCSTRFFRDFPPKFFAYCTSLMKITIRIPVAYLSLEQACIYHLRAYHKIEYTDKTAQISTRLYLLLVHLPHAKSKSDKRRKFSDLLFTP